MQAEEKAVRGVSYLKCNLREVLIATTTKNFVSFVTLFITVCVCLDMVCADKLQACQQ